MDRDLRVVLSARVFSDQKCFGPGVSQLLKRVDELHSLRAAAMSLSLIVPASAVYCPHDYYASTAVWYTDDGPRLQTRHWQMTIRCHNCGYADAEKEHTFPVRLELPEGCSVLVCRNLRVIGSAPVAV